MDGALKPSSETPLHLGVYNARPDVDGIAHVHSAHANAVGALGLDVPPIVGTLWRYVGGTLETATFMESGLARVRGPRAGRRWATAAR